MTKRTRTIHWGRSFAASLLMVCGVAGCGGGPTAPSATQPATSATAPATPATPPRGPAPTILSVSPSIGSTGGGASIMITGTGLAPGIRVGFGATNVVADSSVPVIPDRIYVTTPSHALGSVDVMVTNPDGQNAVAIGAYTFAAPESFDVNGNWGGVLLRWRRRRTVHVHRRERRGREHDMRDVRVGEAVAAGPNHPR